MHATSQNTHAHNALRVFVNAGLTPQKRERWLIPHEITAQRANNSHTLTRAAVRQGQLFEQSLKRSQSFG